MAAGARASGWALLPVAALLGGPATLPASAAAKASNDTTTVSAADTTDAGGQDRRARCQPKHDRHGTWNGSTEPGGEYVLTCDPGYAVDREPRVTLTCSEDEVQWNADPWCEDVDDCSKRMYGCGPAGLCVDHVGFSECVCERGAVVRNMSNGEEVCYFKNETKHCGGRNCGAHGICVDLTQYQQSFDTGDESFRCSCERGFQDDGSTCNPVDCGKRHDAMGTWSGTSHYLGEYTLACQEGAFIAGGSQKAITVSCPSDGRWESAEIFNSTPPRCQSPTQELHDEHVAEFRFWVNIVMALVCICGAALAAGLTMGLVSLEPREMEIIQRARLDHCLTEQERERLEKQKNAAQHILPLIKDHHHLLVTLLLLNALANEALPIFLDELVSPVVAVLLSVTFVLLCGEILPSAVFTGPLQLTIASMFIPCVRLLLCGLYAIAKPIAVGLDMGLPHKSPEEELYSRPEIRAVLSLHSSGPTGELCRRSASAKTFGVSPMSSDALMDEEVGVAQDVDAPLDALETRLCSGILDLGEVQVAESKAFQSVRRCSSAFHAVAVCCTADEAAGAAATAGAEAIVFFRSLEHVKWPVDVPLEELLGIVKLSELLAAGPKVMPRDLCVGRAVVQANETVTDALSSITDVCGTPCGFAIVIQRNEFIGLLDGEEALAGMLLSPEQQEADGLRSLRPQPLPRESAEAVGEALSSRRDVLKSGMLSPVREQSRSELGGNSTPLASTSQALSPTGSRSLGTIRTRLGGHVDVDEPLENAAGALSAASSFSPASQEPLEAASGRHGDGAEGGLASATTPQQVEPQVEAQAEAQAEAHEECEADREVDSVVDGEQRWAGWGAEIPDSPSSAA